MCVLPFSSGNTFSKPRWGPHGNESGDLLTEAIQPSLFLGPFVVGFIAAPMASPAVCAIFVSRKVEFYILTGCSGSGPICMQNVPPCSFPFSIKNTETKQNKTCPSPQVRALDAADRETGPGN